MFLYSAWSKLPLPTRAKLAEQFGFAKTGPTHVANDQIVSDGYKLEDVERALNVDAIQKFTGVEDTDMQTLWDLMVNRIESPIVVDVAEKEAPRSSKGIKNKQK